MEKERYFIISSFLLVLCFLKSSVTLSAFQWKQFLSFKIRYLTIITHHDELLRSTVNVPFFFFASVNTRFDGFSTWAGLLNYKTRVWALYRVWDNFMGHPNEADLDVTADWFILERAIFKARRPVSVRHKHNIYNHRIHSHWFSESHNHSIVVLVDKPWACNLFGKGKNILYGSIMFLCLKCRGKEIMTELLCVD
jgi:hypothetical protein